MAAQGSSVSLLPLRPILDWLPGETLFSLCSRYHFISGHRTPAQTCATLFGSARAGSAHDVPSNVQALVDRTDGSLGTAREIILEHTLLPFYFPFHSNLQCENWLIQVSTGSSPALKAQMGLAASQFGASHPLKACPICMQSDTRDFGVGYWHVDHQVPGVHTCPAHQTPLHFATDKVSGKDRFGWVLPHQASLKSPLANQVLKKGDRYLLAEGAMALLRLPAHFTFALDKLHTLYRGELVRQDFVQRTSSRFNQKLFEHALSDFVAANSLTAFWPWLASAESQRSLSVRLLRMCHPTSPRVSRHPLNHLLLIALLFESWPYFWDAYDTVECGGRGFEGFERELPHIATKEAGNSSEERKASLINAIRSGKSFSVAAKLNGVTVTTAMAWAAKEGISSPRRPKVINPDLRSNLIKQLQRGIDKATLATATNISVVSVTRLLLTEPGLHTQWRSARFSRALERSRKSWLRIIEAFPTASSNEWRRLDPTVYAWLYRNDRSWLQSSISKRSQAAAVSSRRRDWLTRDEALAQAVRASALEWHLSHPGKRLTIGTICANVEGLRGKMSAISRLPLTRIAIQQACTTGRIAISEPLSANASQRPI